MKCLIKIQSFSDIITNSSSETFCKINGDKSTLEAIEDLLCPLFGSEYEYDVILDVKNKEDIDPEWYDDYDKLPDQWIEIQMPYRMSEIKDFYKAGLECILKEYFDGQYTITYENN